MQPIKQACMLNKRDVSPGLDPMTVAQKAARCTDGLTLLLDARLMPDVNPVKGAQQTKGLKKP